MKDKAVAAINADELLEWLEDNRKEARHRGYTARVENKEERYSYHTYARAMEDVIREVKHMMFLVGKPADTEEE